MAEAPNGIPKAATITRSYTSALLAILTAIHRVGMI